MMKNTLLKVCVLAAPCFVMAVESELAQVPLEMPQAPEPNVTIIMDDSGSMDWEVAAPNSKTTFIGNQPSSETNDVGEVRHTYIDQISYQCPQNIGERGYLYGVYFVSNTMNGDEYDVGDWCDIADQNAWRFRNSDYNPIYYDPNKTYEPWPGYSTYTYAGTGDRVPFSDLLATLKREIFWLRDYDVIGIDDPYQPGEAIDLANHAPHPDVDNVYRRREVNRDGDGEPDGFSYYTWVDTDNDGLFDNSDEVTEFKVRDLTEAQQINFQNWFTFYRSRELAVKGALGLSLDQITRGRFAYTTLNENFYDLDMGYMSEGDHKLNLFDKIYDTYSNGGTPLRWALDKVGSYYACDTTNSKLLINSSECPVLKYDEGGMCQHNYALLFTDGYWNSAAAIKGAGNKDGSGYSSDINEALFKGVAFHDRHSDTLADVAAYWYLNDLLSGDYQNIVVPSNEDYSRSRLDEDVDPYMHQHMKTYTVSFGLPTGSVKKFTETDTEIKYDTNGDGRIDDDPDSETADRPASGNEKMNFHDIDEAINWPNPTSSNANKIDDLVHAAYNGRGYHYSAKDAKELASGLYDAFVNILRTTSASSAVAFNSQQSEGEQRIFRAYYETKSFSGELESLQIRENPNNPSQLLISDVDWRASEQLQKKIENGQDRVVFTWDKDSNRGIPFDYDNGLTEEQQQEFEQEYPIDRVKSDTAPADLDNQIGDERVNYLLTNQPGDLVGSSITRGQFRERSSVLGDFANSAPVYIGSPKGDIESRDIGNFPNGQYSNFVSSNRSRTPVVYAGSNGGMLHGFDADTGEELMAYVPDIIIDKMYKLTEPTYVHEMFVDGSPFVSDVVVNGKWRTYLMSGLGAGGRGYFVLDVTDPSSFTEAGMATNIKGELTSEHSDWIGYSFSQPTFVMTHEKDSTGNYRWAAIFGNGYNHSHESGESALMVAFLDGFKGRNQTPNWNQDLIVLDTGAGTLKVPTGEINGLGEPRATDVDGDGLVDYVYAGDLAGNLYRFNLQGSKSRWDMEQTLFIAKNEDNQVQPITTQPLVDAADLVQGTYMVVVGTGAWFRPEDLTNKDTQSIYGIWDTTENSGYPVDRDDLVKQEFVTRLDKVHGYEVRTVSNKPVPLEEDEVMGWVVDFDMCAANDQNCNTPQYPGEKAVRKMLLVENNIYGSTLLTNEVLACIENESGWLFIIDSQTGGTGSTDGFEPKFDLNNDGEFDTADLAGPEAGESGENVPGMIRRQSGSLSGPTPIPDPGGDQLKLCAQTSEGEVVCVDTKPPKSYPTGRLSWRELKGQ